MNNEPLEDREIGIALLEAQKKKSAKMREEFYWNTLKKEPTPIEMTAVDLEEYVTKLFLLRNGKNFIVDDFNSRVFELLLWYFSLDSRFAEAGYNPQKGIALYGAVGCGKTAIMKMFRENPMRCYGIRGCREVSDAVEQYGSDATSELIGKLKTSHNKFRHFELGICFDDLGLEPIETVYYGNRKKIMEEILWTRYHKELPFTFTHITTNLNATEIRERYGERIASRMNEMFNFISFPENAPDRRK